MDLHEAYKALDSAVKEFVTAAMTDDKTPLGNVLALTQAASLVGAGENNPDVVIFADLNRFKGLNDQFGHAVGDGAISAVGQLIFELASRCEAKAYRRGGDEFVILLSRTMLEDFTQGLDVFKSCSFKFEGRTHKTAVSFGYSIRAGELDYAALLDRAELACRAAKSQGDGVCVEWSEDLARQALVNLRDRCGNCGAQIVVNVPNQTAPTGGRLIRCPSCGNSLTANKN